MDYRELERFMDAKVDRTRILTETQDEVKQILTKEKEVFEDPAFKSLIARAAYMGNWSEIGRTGREDLPNTKWKYQNYLSDERRAVWYNPYLKTVVVSFRGTKTSGEGSVEDLLTDAGILLNATKHTPIYQEDEKFMRRVIKDFPDAEIEVIGHSLGGHRAKVVGRNFGVKSVGFNEGASPFGFDPTGIIGDTPQWWISLRCKLNPSHKMCQHKSYHVAFDPISVSTHLWAQDLETKAYPYDSYAPLDAHTPAMKDAWPLPQDLMVCNDDGSRCL